MRLEQLLRDPDFVMALVTERTPERHVLYEDPQLKFCVLAHKYDGAKDSPPHDHGPSWAIYGQAQGETEMTDFALVASPVLAQAPAGGDPRVAARARAPEGAEDPAEAVAPFSPRPSEPRTRWPRRG